MVMLCKRKEGGEYARGRREKERSVEGTLTRRGIQLIPIALVPAYEYTYGSTLGVVLLMMIYHPQ